MEAQEFLDRMKQQDPRVFTALMPELKRLTLGACHTLRIPDEDRPDIVQDVAMRVFRKWEQFQGRSKLSTWIYTIAYHRCLDALNRAAAQPPIVPIGPPPDDDDGGGWIDPIDHSHSDPHQTRCVQAVLGELRQEPPPRKKSVRKIDLLTFWIEHSPTTEELAQFLDTTLAAAKERKRYVWEALRELCRKHCGNDECGLDAGVQA